MKRIRNNLSLAEVQWYLSIWLEICPRLPVLVLKSVLVIFLACPKCHELSSAARVAPG